MKTKHWISVGAAGALALGTLAVWQGTGSNSAVSRRWASSGGAQPSAPCAFEAGQELAYDVRIEVERTLREGPLAAGAREPIKSSVAAELHARVLEVEPSGAVLLAKYANVEQQGASESLGAPFLLRVDPSCRLAGFARHSGTSAQAGRAQQAIAYELNYVAAAAGARAELDADDSIGRYHGSFTAHMQGARLVIERSALRYAKLWEKPELSSALEPSESRGEVVMDGGPWLEQLSSRQLLRGAGSADVDSRVEVSRIEATTGALDGAESDAKRYIWENLLPRLRFPRAGRPVTQRDLAARAAVKDQTLEQAVVDHVVRSRELVNFADIWPPTTTYLEARPEQTERFVNALRTGEVPPEGRAAGWVAVGQARTPEARIALLTVLHDDAAPGINRTRAMFALVDREDVGVELTTELAGYAMGISSAPSDDGRLFARESALAMGMMAGLRRETDPEVRATAVAAIPKLLASQRTAEGLSPVFGAIANLGDASTMQLVEPYTRHLDAKIRAGAARSFRHLPPAELTSLLAPWLTRESDAAVKRELYLTLGKQMHDTQQSAAPAVIDRAIVDLKAHPGVTTRRALIQVLGVAAKEYPAARQALMAQAKKETALRSGLYPLITRYLGADDLLVALSSTAEAP